jgi:hypothetical protein
MSQGQRQQHPGPFVNVVHNMYGADVGIKSVKHRRHHDDENLETLLVLRI